MTSFILELEIRRKGAIGEMGTEFVKLELAGLELVVEIAKVLGFSTDPGLDFLFKLRNMERIVRGCGRCQCDPLRIRSGGRSQSGISRGSARRGSNNRRIGDGIHDRILIGRDTNPLVSLLLGDKGLIFSSFFSKWLRGRSSPDQVKVRLLFHREKGR